MNADEWRARVPVVTVYDPCPECKTLQPDVKERTYFCYYMQVKVVCCAACFVKREQEGYSG